MREDWLNVPEYGASITDVTAAVFIHIPDSKNINPPTPLVSEPLNVLTVLFLFVFV
jgi:hypothetical protein